MTTATAIPAGTYTTDGVHSSAGFAVKHMLSTFRGSFGTVNAEVTVNEDGSAGLDLTVNGDTATLTGDLAIKGHTERVTAEGTVAGPVEDPFGNTKLGLQFETVVDRTQFGLNWNAPLPKGGFMLANDVTISVDLELAQA